MKKGELIASVQQLATGLNNLADALSEPDTNLWIYADLIQANATRLAAASTDLNTYATDVHTLEQAVQAARQGGRI